MSALALSQLDTSAAIVATGALLSFFLNGCLRRAVRVHAGGLPNVGAGDRHRAVECLRPDRQHLSAGHYRVLRDVPKDHIDVLDALQARVSAIVGVKTVNGDV